MKKLHERILELKKGNTMPHQERILSQLEFVLQLSQINSDRHAPVIIKAIDLLSESVKLDGMISRKSAENAEKIIIELSEEAKSYEVICTAHAHIDMNWMWGYAETVAITLDTFRTMLDLMREYPDYKFSQSQASVFSIVDEFDPEMMEEIKQRVAEGRFEVTASSWVETDKNMPNGESLSRHILYTKRYLSELLGIDPDSLNIDFEPDTFGHNANVPEILAKGGVKYFYHNRGYNGHTAYRWEAPSGESVIAYKDPHWYISAIGPELAFPIVRFCDGYKTKTALKVYGVGDHGGGPTRRDIERMIEMNSWPVFPKLIFGTFAQFFESLEKVKDNLPVVKGELNFIFPGCYTTQTRIKMSNRIGEEKLYEAETAAVFSKLYTQSRYRSDMFEEAWRKVLFNHFHDILPGSGIIDTREYSMGEFQKVLAVANTQSSISWKNILSMIDTSKLKDPDEKDDLTVSEGAGVGFGIKDFGVPRTERGRGKTRIYHFINSTGTDRDELSELVVWDWPGDKNRVEVTDGSGELLKIQLVDNEVHQFFGRSYWGHEYMRILVKVRVPAYGYTTIKLCEAAPGNDAVIYPGLHEDFRTEKLDEYVLDNDSICVRFDPESMSVFSFYDKTNKKDHIKGKAAFRFIEEDDKRGMTAWIIGRYINNRLLLADVKVKETVIGKGLLRQWIKYSQSFENSEMNVTVMLDADSAQLKYIVECDWREMSKKGSYIPQLGFVVPLGYESKKYIYDIPFGVIERDGMDMDVPANSFAVSVPQDSSTGLMLVTDSKYGFRCTDDSLSVTLIRSSYDPDPHPEVGMHKFAFALCLSDISVNRKLIDTAQAYKHPLCSVSTKASNGTLPLDKGFLSIAEGDIVISSIKMAESDEEALFIRLYEAEGNNTKAAIDLMKEPKEAFYTDINEKLVKDTGEITIDGSVIRFDVTKNSVINLMIRF